MQWLVNTDGADERCWEDGMWGMGEGWHGQTMWGWRHEQMCLYGLPVTLMEGSHQISTCLGHSSSPISEDPLLLLYSSSSSSIGSFHIQRLEFLRTSVFIHIYHMTSFQLSCTPHLMPFIPNSSFQIHPVACVHWHSAPIGTYWFPFFAYLLHSKCISHYCIAQQFAHRYLSFTLRERSFITNKGSNSLNNVQSLLDESLMLSQCSYLCDRLYMSYIIYQIQPRPWPCWGTIISVNACLFQNYFPALFP